MANSQVSPLTGPRETMKSCRHSRTYMYIDTVLTRRFGGDYLAEGSANCAAMNIILNFFRQHVISGSKASLKGAGRDITHIIV